MIGWARRAAGWGLPLAFHRRAHAASRLLTTIDRLPGGEPIPCERSVGKFGMGRDANDTQGHPAANALRKQPKSRTFRIGGAVELSQLAASSPEAKRLRKQAKSRMLSMGCVV